MGEHAILSPSAASRWLSCTPSARLEIQFPDRAGDAAKEGTLAHSLGELILSYKTKLVTKAAFTKRLKVIQADKFYNEAMYEYADNYAVFVMEKLSEAQLHTPDAKLYLEQKLDLTEYVSEGYGTGDSIIVANETLIINDLKYGKGVPVSVVQNKQMMLYALGALAAFGFLYDIQIVQMNIYQPRLDNISTWEIPVSELLNWAETELKPRAALAFKGEGQFNPGEACRFCRAKTICKAAADHNLELAKYEFKASPFLEDGEIVDVISKAAEFREWLTAVEDYALDKAVNENKHWPGYKLVEGRSNRQYVSSEKVAEKLISKGISEDLIYNKQLLGITAMEKALGKSEFNAYLSDMVIKPTGKPTLVPEDDKRPAYNSIESAQKDFA